MFKIIHIPTSYTVFNIETIEFYEFKTRCEAEKYLQKSKCYYAKDRYNAVLLFEEKWHSFEKDIKYHEFMIVRIEDV